MTEDTDIWNKLAMEFPREEIEWRAQNLKADGTSALALAYITARHVMDRLDEAVGPANWSDRYEFSGGTAICYLSLRIAGEWVTKADGAGTTDVEAEKGQISDALKRAAVKWGIGRYLYEIDSPWVPCDSYKNRQDKLVWKKWTANPWDFVKTTEKAPRSPAGGLQEPLPTSAAQPHWRVIADALQACTTVAQLNGVWSRHEPVFHLFDTMFQGELKTQYLACRDALQAGTVEPKPTRNNPAPSAAKPDYDAIVNGETP
jgi:hypothetical protein